MKKINAPDKLASLTHNKGKPNMVSSLKKMWAAMAVTLAAATSLVGAAIPAPVNDGVATFDRTYDRPYDRFDGGYDPCCCPPSNCCWGTDWAFSAEALVFQACEDGLTYGTSIEIPFVDGGADPNAPREIFARVREPHFDWDWGYRLGFYYNLPCDCWGLAVLWTHYNTHARSTDDTPFNDGPSPTIPGTFFRPAYGHSRGLEDIDHTEARWKLRLDLVDVELGRPFCISQCLTLRPYIGVRAAWVNQSYDIDNFRETLVGTATVEAPIQQVHLSSKYEGVGLRSGLDTTWDLGCGICLYGKASANILAGHFDIKSTDEFFFNEDSFTYNPDQTDDFCACRAILDAAIGICWHQAWCNDCIHLTLNVGWEQHIFINHNQFEDFVQLDTEFFDSSRGTTFDSVKNPQFHRGDLCLKGIHFGAKFEF